LRKQSGVASGEHRILVFIAVLLLGLTIKGFWTSAEFHDAAAMLWGLVTLAVFLLVAGQARLLWMPAGACAHIALALVAVPLSWLTQLMWAVALIAFATGGAAMIAGARYTEWFTAKVLPRYAHAPLPLYLDQRFNLVMLLVVFIGCVALAGLALVITLPVLALLPVPASVVPWLAPALPLVVLIAVMWRNNSRVLKLATAVYLTAAVLARMFRVELCGPYGDGAWELIWYSVFVPLFAAGVPLLFAVQARGSLADGKTTA
jgi:hypothetical protein